MVGNCIRDRWLEEGRREIGEWKGRRKEWLNMVGRGRVWRGKDGED